MLLCRGKEAGAFPALLPQPSASRGPWEAGGPPRQAGVAIQGCWRPPASVPWRMTGDACSCHGGRSPSPPPLPFPVLEARGPPAVTLGRTRSD